MNGATAAGAEYTIFRVGVLLNRGSSSPAVVAKAGYIGDGLSESSLRLRRPSESGAMLTDLPRRTRRLVSPRLRARSWRVP